MRHEWESKSMTRYRMRVTITVVTAKTCQTDEQPTRDMHIQD